MVDASTILPDRLHNAERMQSESDIIVTTAKDRQTRRKMPGYALDFARLVASAGASDENRT